MRDERGPGTWGTVVTVLRKDLLLELRGLDTLPAMVLFAIVTFVIFHFGLNQTTIEGQEAAGVLTVTLLFVTVTPLSVSSPVYVPSTKIPPPPTSGPGPLTTPPVSVRPDTVTGIDELAVISSTRLSPCASIVVVDAPAPSSATACGISSTPRASL